jgi:hypothetical protein
MTNLFTIDDETTHVIGDPKCPECAEEDRAAASSICWPLAGSRGA